MLNGPLCSSVVLLSDLGAGGADRGPDGLFDLVFAADGRKERGAGSGTRVTGSRVARAPSPPRARRKRAEPAT